MKMEERVWLYLLLTLGGGIIDGQESYRVADGPFSVPGTSVPEITKTDTISQLSAERNIDLIINPAIAIPKTPQSKNTIYVTGSYLLIGGSVSVNYERLILNMGKNSSMFLFLRAAYGYWAVWTSGGPAGILSANILFLKNVHHIETGFGVVKLYDKKSYEYALENARLGYNPPVKNHYMIFNPVINVGYRYQNPENHIMLRIGLSYPEALYAGLGVNF